MLGRYTTGPLQRGRSIPEETLIVRRIPRLYSAFMPVIDLRSDTVTKPSPAMRRAMAEAEVGDDVFGDDPTVIALEARAAELLGKEAGLFVASGSMGNIVAQLAHLGRGQETIAGKDHHLTRDEAAGHAVIVGTSIRALDDRPDGTLDLDEVEAAFRDPSDPHEPISGMVAVENTHAHSMGQPLTPEYTRAIADVAHRHGVPLHIDGARFWDAVVALGVRATDLAGPADSVTFCLSKGLGCPVGSVVVGDRAFIWRARRARKLVGGGMRQVGILAAAGLIALRDGPEGMIERLADDHANARRLAQGLAALDGIVSPGGIAQPETGRLDPARVRTNFVVFKVERDRGAFLDALRARNVLMVEYPYGQIRAVTHYGIGADDIDSALEAVEAALAETAPGRSHPVAVRA
jgi:threonine aldolase